MFVHLPVILQFSSSKKGNINKGLQLFVFLYSALFGMLTHVLWDSFTHLNGFMVKKLSILTNSVPIMNIQIPIYKLLQHGSTLIGITAIISFMLYRASKYRYIKKDNVNAKQKFMYWSRIALLTLFIFCIWCIFDRISITFYGIIVVRIIDSTLISLLVVSMYYNNSNNKTNSLKI